jgi:hypothetical protein
MMPTIVAATAALTPVISCAIGEAWLMIEIPAETFKKSKAQRAYHCQLVSAWRSVKLPAAAAEEPVAGCQPAGFQPGGGSRINSAAPITTTSEALPSHAKVWSTPTD